jgi:4-amino-4-deoxy-L-arabinose transferase-like glycosyltransferase
MSVEDRKLFNIALAVIAAISLVRVAVLILSPLNLYPDEAQYWWWAQTPAFGYFSKPPMIAWAIWLTTHIFGNSEWAIRIFSPVIHGATALVLFAIVRRLFDARIALWSALAYLTTPGVSYSSGLASTDVPLLFFWAAALYGFVRAMDDKSWLWGLFTGIAFGLGLEAKYAMFYFVLCAGVAAMVLPEARRVVLSLRALAALAIGLLLLLPNVLWNAARHFPTVSHTESNADWGHAHYSLLNLFAFVGGQFGVFGPLLMLGFILALWAIALGLQRDRGTVLLAAFCVPPLILIVIQSFISEANANWAATAYIAATPLAIVVIDKLWHRRIMWASFAFDGVVMLALWIILVSPSIADRIGQGNAFKRMEGWDALGQAVVNESQLSQYDTIAAANRSVTAELLYYARPHVVPMHEWASDSRDNDHFQMTMRLTPPIRRTLMVLMPDEAPSVSKTFDSFSLLKTIDTPIGGKHHRIIALYDAMNYRGPQSSH